MVVIPSGGPISYDFAIGKYEISVEDWAKYCALSGNCEPVSDRSRFDDPITGISLAEAQQYIDWLSKRTRKTYRLPTSEEWEHAASVGGRLSAEDEAFSDIKGQINCRVTLGDKILKGTNIVTIKSGRPNQWGLYNFVGNVQEWVPEIIRSPPNRVYVNSVGFVTEFKKEPPRITARGGAFSDEINSCDISMTRDHNGSADDITGFRVLRENVE
jgi:formylglycine-generating enzyme required for sulfatase activity